MSTDYSLTCHSHRERVDLCSDGMSGPLLQADKTLAFFAITHQECSLAAVWEHDDAVNEYLEWSPETREELFTYDYPGPPSVDGPGN